MEKEMQQKYSYRYRNGDIKTYISKGSEKLDE